MTVSSIPAEYPDYEQLVRFLFQPFLSAAESLSVDCEYTLERNRVWVRVAVASIDQEAAFGRGGRNIQAIRTVLQSAATAVGKSLHLDVHGANFGSSHSTQSHSSSDEASANRPPRVAPTKRSPNGGAGNAPPRQRS